MLKGWSLTIDPFVIGNRRPTTTPATGSACTMTPSCSSMPRVSIVATMS